MVAVCGVDGDDVVRDAVLAEGVPDDRLGLGGHGRQLGDARKVLLVEVVDQVVDGR